MFHCNNLEYLLSCEVEHGIDLITVFLDERAEAKIKDVYYFAQPNGLNQDKSFDEFRRSLTTSRVPAKTEAEIMTDVKEILALFDTEGEPHGDI